MTAGHDDEALRRRAGELGVETSYEDVDHQHHVTPVETLRRVVEVLESDVAPDGCSAPPVVVVTAGATGSIDVAGPAQVELTDGTVVELPVAGGGRPTVAPGLPVGCHRVIGADGTTTTLVVAPARMPRAAGLAGRAAMFVPAYALWERGSALPSFGHLGALAARLPDLGVDVLATLPLYAAFLDDPFDPSPYSPVSRLHWNEAYLDDSSVAAAPVPPFERLVDWRLVGRRRREQLLEAATDLDPYVQHGMERFAAGRPDVGEYARFRTERRDPVDAGRPAELVARSHVLAQYLAHRQLAAVEGSNRAALALDLPVGSHPQGYETWAHPELFAPGMSVGAPPDELFAGGQDWGFPPQLPGAGRRSGHDLWRRVVARAGEHCSVLRIDHVMAVHRLWWVPEGMSPTEGTYVRYPREELLAVIAAQAAASLTTVVGEDLGTVPDAIVEAMARWDALGMDEEQFRLGADRLDPIPARSMAGVRTHDMPAFAAAYVDAPTAERYRHLLERCVGHAVGDSGAAVFDGVLERLASSAAYLVVADLDDLLGEVLPHNVPGSVQPTSWRRRTDLPMSAMLTDDVRRRLTLLRTRPGVR